VKRKRERRHEDGKERKEKEGERRKKRKGRKARTFLRSASERPSSSMSTAASLEGGLSIRSR
jgi:hypothetical protein